MAADRLLLNGVPVRLRGFGMHEDVPLRGKGHDDARMVRDFALLDWIGANSFRTSHYPYAEEVLDYADRKGVLVIGARLARFRVGSGRGRLRWRDGPGEQFAEPDLDVAGAHPGDRILELGQNVALPGGLAVRRGAGLVWACPAVRLWSIATRHNPTLPAVASALHPVCAEKCTCTTELRGR